MTSSIIVRVSRMTTAENAMPRISAGIVIWARFLSASWVKGMYFTSGDQPHQINGNTITSVPTQKPGSTSARMAKERAR